MARKSTTLGGKFIYALTSVMAGRNINARGVNRAPVYTVTCGDKCAVVSDIFTPRARPDRHNLMAHRTVLKYLLDQGVVLPMRFGVIAHSARALERLLAENEEAIAQQLAQLSGKVEMGLRVTWKVANIYQYFVDTHPQLAAARDHMLATRQGIKLREEKLALGQLYERLRDEQRIEHQRLVESALCEACHDICSLPARGEKTVMHLACLIGADDMDRFDRSVAIAAQQFDNPYLFDYTGPWAPHNFVHLDLSLENSDRRHTEAG